MPDTFIERQSVPDQVARAILDFLKHEGYSVGEKLPTTKALCERFGVGYPTLREAIQQLETLGFIHVRHGSGIYVRNIDDRLFVGNPMGMEFSPKALLDFIQARKAIEPAAAALAATWATQDDIASMKSALDESARNISDDVTLRKSNSLFHRHIAEASGNRAFEEIVSILMSVFAKEQHDILYIFAEREKDLQEHRAILKAIEDKDPERSEQLMLAHLMGVEKALKEYFGHAG